LEHGDAVSTRIRRCQPQQNALQKFVNNSTAGEVVETPMVTSPVIPAKAGI
jgi:hypothetical protein